MSDVPDMVDEVAKICGPADFLVYKSARPIGGPAIHFTEGFLRDRGFKGTLIVLQPGDDLYALADEPARRLYDMLRRRFEVPRGR